MQEPSLINISPGGSFFVLFLYLHYKIGIFLLFSSSSSPLSLLVSVFLLLPFAWKTNSKMDWRMLLISFQNSFLRICSGCVIFVTVGFPVNFTTAIYFFLEVHGMTYVFCMSAWVFFCIFIAPCFFAVLLFSVTQVPDCFIFHQSTSCFPYSKKYSIDTSCFSFPLIL